MEGCPGREKTYEWCVQREIDVLDLVPYGYIPLGRLVNPLWTIGIWPPTVHQFRPHHRDFLKKEATIVVADILKHGRTKDSGGHATLSARWAGACIGTTAI